MSRIAYRLGRLVARMTEQVRRRPVHAAAVAVVLVGLGVVSCQTPPRSDLRRDGAGGAGAAAGPVESSVGEPEMRIRIKAGLEQVKLSGSRSFAVQPLAGKPALMDGPLIATATATGVRIADAKGATRNFDGLSPLEIVPTGGSGEAEAGGTARVLIDGMSYPGTIRIVPRGTRVMPQATGPAMGPPVLGAPQAGGGAARAQPSTPARLDVIESLPMETYLVGVIGAEMLPKWSLGAFQVAAVCGRTYALHERERVRRLGRDYDLESTTADQAYNGGAQLPVAAQAVKDTRGVVVTWQGRLLRTYYSSTCGGRTASAADIWPTGPGFEFNLDLPIQAHHREAACEGSTRYRWAPVRDRAELSRRIREWGKANGHPVAGMALLSVVRVVATNKDDRPTKYEVEDDRRRRFTLACEELRKACQQTVAGLPALAKEQAVWASDFEAFEVKGATVTIRGRGFGHGVGMCQYCTEAFSQRGDPWREIVLRYYPGAKLERAY